MRLIIRENFKEIRKYYLKRISFVSDSAYVSINNELKEWIDDSFNGNEDMWTLPDLTQTQRLENFCRSIKKKIK